MLKWLAKLDLTVVTGALLGVAAIATIVLQIVFSGSATTKLETSLFGALQFVLSLGFAWVLSRISFRKQFMESQKSFAVAAYRRICEIDRAATRLTSRTGNRMSGASTEMLHELEVILAIGVGIRQAVKSSIADWADVIGEEIVTLQKIEEITSEQEAILEQPSVIRTVDESQPAELAPVEFSTRVATLEKQVERLRDSLPPSLRLLSRGDREGDAARVRQQQAILQGELEKPGGLVLEGFWEPDAGFERSIREIAVGTKLTVSSGDAGNRVGVLIVRDNQDESVGLLINGLRTPLRYFAFVEALIQALGRSVFEVELLSIEEHDSKSRRTYFKVKAVGSNAELSTNATSEHG